MAIIAKFTRTLPAPTATISGGFVFLLSAGWFTDSDTGTAGSPIDGGTNSMANGGGDMQIFSDTTTTTQLPIQVVTFVTGGSPQCQVWVRTPSYTSGDTITIGKDGTQTTQPSVTSSFGRNAVWADFEAVIHANETSTNGVFVDSTGNGHDTTLTTGSSLSTSSTGHPFGGTWPDFTGAEVLTLTNSYQSINNTAFTMSVWLNADVAANNDGLFGTRYTGSEWAQIQTNGRCFSIGNEGENLADTNQTSGVTRLYKLKQNNISLDNIVSGTQESTDTTVSDGESINAPSGNDFRIGTYFDNAASRRYDGRAAEFRLKRSKDSSDYDSSEYDNYNDPDNFGTSSEYILVGGGGTTVTVNLIEQTQTIDQVTLTENSIISIGGLSQAQTIDQITLQQSGTLTVNNLQHIQTIDQINLTQAHIVSVNDLSQLQTVDQVTLNQGNVLAVNDTDQLQAINQVTTSTAGTVAIHNASQVQTLEQLVLAIAGTVAINNLSQSQLLEQLNLTQAHVVSVDNLSQAQLLQSINFNGVVVGYLQGALTIVSAYNGQIKLTNPLTGEIRIL
jgi:hypothetical protein